jgi:MFS-type transporter involved in bile tolerance (Atg22 family)
MATARALPLVGPSSNVRNYVLVTAAYWADTLTDGAVRMLVLLYFYQRGYTAIEVAMLFLFYEVFGIVTNLAGGWMAARLGLKTTLFAGLGMQVVALGMLALVEPA